MHITIQEVICREGKISPFLGGKTVSLVIIHTSLLLAWQGKKGFMTLLSHVHLLPKQGHLWCDHTAKFVKLQWQKSIHYLKLECQKSILLCPVDKLTFYPLWPRAMGCSISGLHMQKVYAESMCYFWSRVWEWSGVNRAQSHSCSPTNCPAGPPWILHIINNTELALGSRSPSTDSH